MFGQLPKFRLASPENILSLQNDLRIQAHIIVSIEGVENLSRRIMYDLVNTQTVGAKSIG